MKRVFIIQNTPLNEPLPLSVYLTGIAKELIKNKEYDIKFIVAKTNNLPDFLDKNQIISLNTSQYSIKDMDDPVSFQLFFNPARPIVFDTVGDGRLHRPFYQLFCPNEPCRLARYHCSICHINPEFRPL